jgi:hypothetical protein
MTGTFWRDAMLSTQFWIKPIQNKTIDCQLKSGADNPEAGALWLQQNTEVGHGKLVKNPAVNQSEAEVKIHRGLQLKQDWKCLDH